MNMFASSTQRKHWMFDNPERLERLRVKANEKARKRILESGKATNQSQLLTPKEELYLIRSYLEFNLREFCRKFQPPMKRSVVATAFNYVKRFYLNESCMEYHPKKIAVTCAYLACKVDEFNVSIDQFIKNIKGDSHKAQKTVLSNELLVMKKLQFHLTVHLPFRAVEGFLIDLRARYKMAREQTSSMSEEIEGFLERSMYTDACFLFTPSQIALAAIYYGAERCNLNLDNYLKDFIFSEDADALKYFLRASSDMRKLIEMDLQNSPGKDTIRKIEKKLQDRGN